MPSTSARRWYTGICCTFAGGIANLGPMLRMVSVSSGIWAVVALNMAFWFCCMLRGLCWLLRMVLSFFDVVLLQVFKVVVNEVSCVVMYCDMTLWVVTSSMRLRNC
uniref:(northern house mosquito) hypothetical protein n=1 Tax=Culex pipiens TaxID=7175 RepID=A0A8D8B6G2_CULPI